MLARDPMVAELRQCRQCRDVMSCGIEERLAVCRAVVAVWHVVQKAWKAYGSMWDIAEKFQSSALHGHVVLSQSLIDPGAVLLVACPQSVTARRGGRHADCF